jgi:hypothetical protein
MVYTYAATQSCIDTIVSASKQGAFRIDRGLVVRRDDIRRMPASHDRCDRCASPQAASFVAGYGNRSHGNSATIFVHRWRRSRIESLRDGLCANGMEVKAINEVAG